MRLRCGALLFAGCAFMIAAPVKGQGILKREPPWGRLGHGEIVFVDDGSCPKGQIKKVTGGSGHAPGRPVVSNAPRRHRECIVRPPWN